MTYQDCLEFLYQKLPMFQRQGAAALKYDLSNTLNLLDRLNNPHQSLKTIHIAGTNGKGSSAHTIAAVMTAAGYKTGLFTSPHLKSFTERARINGVEMPEEFVIAFVNENKALLESMNASFFEVSFVMSMLYFKQHNVDVAVIETGLGGRLDSTNVILPEICLITSIGLDHTDLLGETLSQIAKEKAGIIKSNTPVVIGADQPEILHVFQERASELNASLFTSEDIVVLNDSGQLKITSAKREFQIEEIMPGLKASYYLLNLPGVIQTLLQLKAKGWNISDNSIKKGIENVVTLSGIKGRYQMIGQSPLTIADISHNLPGLTELFAQIGKEKKGLVHLVFGVVRDKSIDAILGLIQQQSAMKCYFTQSSVPRSLPANELQDKARAYGLVGEIFSNVNDAIDEARNSAQNEDMVLVCGSTFVVAEINDL